LSIKPRLRLKKITKRRLRRRVFDVAFEWPAEEAEKKHKKAAAQKRYVL